MDTATGTEPYYDPYDVEINADPYPHYQRLREEATYHNERYDFWALSRHETTGRLIGWLAKLLAEQGRVALEELLKRFPEWELDYDGMKLASTTTVRGWQSVPIVLPG